MPLFRRKTDSSLPRRSLSVYGQGRAQVLISSRNAEKSSDSGSFSSLDMDDRPQPFLAFAEATFDPSLPIKTKSRLSKDLDEVLHDNAALAYFIQFMDATQSKHLVKFWLEAESFRISSETRRKSQSQKSQTPQLPETALFASKLPSSGSSGCISDKSDEVFQSSSHTNFKDSNENCRASEQEASDFQKCIFTTNDSNEVSTDGDKKTMRFLDTVSEEICKDRISCNIQKTSEFEKSSKNGLENPEVSTQEIKSDFKANGSSEDINAENTQNTTDNNSKLVNSVQSNSIMYDGCATQKQWSQVNCLTSKESGAELLKDGLIIKLETSIEQDANYIYSKYIAQDAPFPIGISEELRNIIYNNIFKSTGHIDPQCFVLVQEFVFKKMDKEFFSTFLRSSFHCKHQIDVLTSGNVFLADVLYNDSALFFFMEFMELETVRHLVDFLLMADNFQKHLLAQESYDANQVQTDAMVLYEKYFSLQATSPLGFSDHIRYEVEANICRDGGPLPDCFVKPVKILTQYLEKTYLLQFLSSQLYFKYISECIIIIQNEGTDIAAQQKLTGSDSGSEQSLPLVNTLLAMDGKQPGAAKILRNIEDQDMRIDTGQFKPDALWQRPLAGKLQMAHVDHLGRVTTEFEPEPDKRRESRISKAVKKLVNWEEDKNQEDMAWKVAEMIVKDICSVTMPNPGDETGPS